MKRSVLVAFSIIVLSGLLLSIALVGAYQSGYINTNYSAITAPVTDGKWTTTDEWVDAMVPPTLPATFHWREKWTQPSDIIQHFIVEAFTDSTNDTSESIML